MSLGLFTQYESLGLTEGEAVRICLASAGVWWAGFTVVSVTLLRNRRPREVVGDPRSGALSGGFRQLGATLRDLRRYPLTLWFLGAYLLFNDGVQTIIGVSAQYGKEQLELSQTTLVSAILLVQVVAFFGALALGRIAARHRREAHRPGRAGGLDGRPGGGVLPRGRRRGAVLRAGGGHRLRAWAAPRRCPGRCSAS